LRALESLKRKPGLSAIVGNAAYAAGQMLLLLLFVRLAGLHQLGVYTLALAVTAPVHLALGMSLRSVRVVEDATQNRFRQYMQLSITASAAAIAISATLAQVWLGAGAERDVIVAVAVMKGTESALELTYGELQRLERLDIVALVQVGRSVLLVLIAWTVLSSGGGALALALALAAAWASLVVLLLWSANGRAEPRTGALYASSYGLLRRVWPMGVAAGAISLNGSLPRIVTFWLLGPEAAGVLAVLSYPVAMLGILGNSLGQSILVPLRVARRARRWKAAARIANRTQVQLGGCGLLLLVGVLVGGDGLLETMLSGYDGDLLGAATVFVFAATVAAFASISYYEVTSMGRYGLLSGINAIVTAVAIPLLIVGARFDLAGIGGAMVAYLALQWASATYVARGSRFQGCSAQTEPGNE
jgi:O-antigen/teichoic acid export membrane protein